MENIPENFVFLESNGRSVVPKENETYICDPFEIGTFYVASADSAKQVELNRFNHYKRVAHLLGLKKFELKQIETEKTTTTTKGDSESGVAKINAELKTTNLDAESFFESEEYDPISGMSKEHYAEVYKQAEEYARSHNLLYANDVQNLLRAREPGSGMLRKRSTKYTYLSRFESTLKLTGDLQPLQNVLKIPSPAKLLVPSGFTFERAKEIIKTQTVTLEMEFYNYEA